MFCDTEGLSRRRVCYDDRECGANGVREPPDPYPLQDRTRYLTPPLLDLTPPQVPPPPVEDPGSGEDPFAYDHPCRVSPTRTPVEGDVCVEFLGPLSGLFRPRERVRYPETLYKGVYPHHFGSVGTSLRVLWDEDTR